MCGIASDDCNAYHVNLLALSAGRRTLIAGSRHSLRSEPCAPRSCAAGKSARSCYFARPITSR